MRIYALALICCAMFLFGCDQGPRPTQPDPEPKIKATKRTCCGKDICDCKKCDCCEACNKIDLSKAE